MPKKQTKKPKYPKELIVFCEPVDHELLAFDSPERTAVFMENYESMSTEIPVAIYKFDRVAKVTRTVKVE